MKIYDWNAEKNQFLIENRSKSFEQIVFYIENGGLLDDIVHPNEQAYPSQRSFVVEGEGYVYLVPYVENEEQIFLKTIIPSRKFTKLYLKEGK